MRMTIAEACIKWKLGLTRVLLAAAAPVQDGISCTQKELSSMVDAAILQHTLDTNQQDAAFHSHVALSRLAGAGVWLTAPPVDDDREIDAALFQVAVKRRLRMPLFSEDRFCPCCGQVLDRFGDHALVCACGGDRVVYEEAREAGARPEREKAGLLPQRPDGDGIECKLSNGRRPADI